MLSLLLRSLGARRGFLVGLRPCQRQQRVPIQPAPAGQLAWIHTVPLRHRLQGGDGIVNSRARCAHLRSFVHRRRRFAASFIGSTRPRSGELGDHSDCTALPPLQFDTARGAAHGRGARIERYGSMQVCAAAPSTPRDAASFPWSGCRRPATGRHRGRRSWAHAIRTKAGIRRVFDGIRLADRGALIAFGMSYTKSRNLTCHAIGDRGYCLPKSMPVNCQT